MRLKIAFLKLLILKLQVFETANLNGLLVYPFFSITIEHLNLGRVSLNNKDDIKVKRVKWFFVFIKSNATYHTNIL
jgi:hypothetical protein